MSAYLNIKLKDINGKEMTQKIKFEAGSNITVTPTSDGKGVNIAVNPDSAWGNTYQLATETENGLMPKRDGEEGSFLNVNGQWEKPSNAVKASASNDGIVEKLPSTNATKKFLRGDNTWAEPKGQDVFSVSREGLCPMLPSIDNDYILTESGWKRYSVITKPFIIIENANYLAKGFDKSRQPLEFGKVESASSIVKINGYNYIAKSFGTASSGKRCRVLIEAGFLSSLSSDDDIKMVFSVYRIYKDDKDVYVARIGYKIGGGTTQYMNSALANKCPNPIIDVYNDWHIYSGMCGWGNTCKGGSGFQMKPYLDAMFFEPMTDTANTYNWLHWSFGYGGHGTGENSKEHRLVFHRPMIKIIDD